MGSTFTQIFLAGGNSGSGGGTGGGGSDGGGTSGDSGSGGGGGSSGISGLLLAAAVVGASALNKPSTPTIVIGSPASIEDKSSDAEVAINRRRQGAVGLIERRAGLKGGLLATTTDTVTNNSLLN